MSVSVSLKSKIFQVKCFTKISKFCDHQGVFGWNTNVMCEKSWWMSYYFNWLSVLSNYAKSVYSVYL